MSEEIKQGDAPEAGDQTNYKAELERMKSENEKLHKSFEDLKSEIMTPDYIDFINARSTGEPEAKVTKTETTIADDLDKLTPKQLYEKIKNEVKAEMEGTVKKTQEVIKQESDAQIMKEVKAFASRHQDYEQLRPVMAGLCNDPRYADASLQELYDAAKDHVRKISIGATEEDKARSKKSMGEKPGGSSSSVKLADKKYKDTFEAGSEAWDAIVGKDGLPGI